MIDLSTFRGQTLAVMGLDRSGLSTVRALVTGGARVWAWDDNEAQHAPAREAGAEIIDLTTADPAACAALVLTPGIPHHLPAPHPVAARFAAAGRDIICDIDLFARTRPQARLVAVTGTNGKSTTTALIGHLCKTAGLPTAVGGNIGVPVLDLPMLESDGVYVLEVSSYQIERSPSLAPDVAVLLNLSPDHLARHGDMEGYRQAKARLLAHPRPGATAVYGTDDALTRQTGEAARGWTLAPISASAAPDLSTARALPGTHNAQNAAAAVAAARALGLPEADITAGLASYPGLPHRQQLLLERPNLRVINDSKATNADSASKALACYDNIYWIVGGRPKETGLTGLEDFMPKVRRAFLLGEAENDFAAWCEGKVPFERCGNLATATRRAFATAEAERLEQAVILLSPACASWDQFRSFEHRGEAFVALVHELTAGGISDKVA